jgi:hypothetical protein
MYLECNSNCSEKQALFACESSLRAVAKAEPSLDRAIYFAQSSLLAQKQRHLHEEGCDTCRADQGLIQ